MKSFHLFADRKCAVILSIWNDFIQMVMAACILFLGIYFINLVHFICKFHENNTICRLKLSWKHWNNKNNIFQAFICYNDPASNPHISEEERDYLKSEIGELKRRDDLPSTPWTSILIRLFSTLLIKNYYFWWFLLMHSSVPIIAFIITQVIQKIVILISIKLFHSAFR